MAECDHKIQECDLEYSNKKIIIELIAGIFNNITFNIYYL